MHSNMSLARLNLIYTRPYFASGIFSMHMVESKRVPTMGVDKYWRLYYNPDFCETLTVEETATVIYHEFWHLLRDHSTRCKSISAEPELWNLAADCEINDDIVDERMKLPDCAVLPSTFKLPNHLTAEEYYEKIKSSAKVVKVLIKGSDSKNSNGGGGSSSDGQGDKDGESESDGNKGSGGKSSDDRSGSVTGGNCGSGADDSERSYELGPPSEQNPGLTSDEAKIVVCQVSKDVKDACNGIGTLPGYLKRWADSVNKPPQVDWRRVVLSKIKSASSYVSGMYDYSYSKYNHKSTGNIIFPGFVKPVLKVAVVADTSGSMSSNELESILVETNALIKKACPSGVNFIPVDTEAYSNKVKVKIKGDDFEGGGGTNMCVGIDAAVRSKPRPNLIIVMTDGYTPWPESPPPIRTLVCLINSDAEVPDFFETIKIRNHCS